MQATNWTHLYPMYAGKWVALAKDEVTVIASDKTFQKAIQTAEKQGHKHPLLFKVPTQMLPYVGTI